MKIPRILVSIGCVSMLALTGVHAFAQWHWVDEQGRKVFSDRPPGPEIPEKNIVKRPALAPVVAASTATGTTARSAAIAAEPSKAPVPKIGASSPQTGGDKAAAEQAQKIKQEQDRAAAARTQSCAAAQRQMAGLKSGGRIARFNDKGEREFLDEAGKSAEMRQAQKVIDSDCK